MLVALDTNELSKYAKNYLPLLFNIYTESTDDSNYFILDCVKSYASITDPEVCHHYYQSVSVLLFIITI